FIAGNEPFDQGPLDWHDAIRAAKARGIDLHIIHAGANVERGWSEAAAFAGSDLVNIDQDRSIVVVKAPQDEEIERLGARLNATYLPYGAGGVVASERQKAQDANARRVEQGATVERALSKTQAAYENSTWDLVDGTNRGRVDVAALAEDDLPP